MYQTGDFVMYRNTGVCRVEEIGYPDAASDQETLYYKLSPVYDTAVIYTPVDTRAFMRPVMSKQAAEQLIDRIPDIPDNVCDNHDIRMLGEQYRACLNTHRNEDLVRLIKSVYQKNRRSVKAGRHMGQTDQQYMKRAEKMLYGELAVVLGMEYDEIQPYIHRRVEEKKKKQA